MFITEQGSHFTEKVSFDGIKKSVTYHVPAHRDISESDFLMDFQSVGNNIGYMLYIAQIKMYRYDLQCRLVKILGQRLILILTNFTCKLIRVKI